MKHMACSLSLGVLAVLGGGEFIVSTAQAQSRFGNAPLGTPLGNLQYQTQGNPTHGPSSYNSAYGSIGPSGPQGFQNGAFEIGGFNRGRGTSGGAYLGPAYYGNYPPIYYGLDNYAPGSDGVPGGGFQEFQEGTFENDGFNQRVATSAGMSSPPINYGNFAPGNYGTNNYVPGSYGVHYGYDLPPHVNEPSGAQGRFQYDWW